MTQRFFDLAFTPAVKAEQARQGSRAAYARAAQGGGAPEETLTGRETAFIALRDSFYLASVSETGWPYVQHRGGPAGFLRVLDGRTLGWAEFAGNRQYVSAGNAAADGRVAMIMVDYAHQRRLKVMGRMRLAEAGEQPDLALRLAPGSSPARIERFALVTVEAFDWNCPQHITPRYTAAEIEAMVAPLQARIAGLEAALARRPAEAA